VEIEPRTSNVSNTATTIRGATTNIISWWVSLEPNDCAPALPHRDPGKLQTAPAARRWAVPAIEPLPSQTSHLQPSKTRQWPQRQRRTPQLLDLSKGLRISLPSPSTTYVTALNAAVAASLPSSDRDGTHGIDVVAADAQMSTGRGPYRLRLYAALHPLRSVGGAPRASAQSGRWNSDLRQMCERSPSPHPAAMYWGEDLVAIYGHYIMLAGQSIQR